jgi:hypothetical protein
MQAAYYDKLESSTSKIWLTILSLAVATLFLLQVWQLFAPGSSKSIDCNLDGVECYDSGFQPVSNGASTTYFFRHRLGAVPRFVEVWFSPTAGGEQAYLISWRFPRIEAGNPIIVEARSDSIFVGVWSGQPIHGVFDPMTEKWTTYNQGFYRVVAYK